MRRVIAATFALALLAGCGMSEEERQQAAHEAAAKAEEQAQVMSERLRSTYDQAYAEGRRVAGEIGDRASDETTKAKLLAAYALMKDLDTSNVQVRVEDGVVYLDGTVPSEQQRMMAEGLAYGVKGDGKKVRSTLNVPK